MSKAKTLVILLFILVTQIAVYRYVLSVWFFADDFHWILTARHATSDLRMIACHRLFDYYRPVVTASFTVEYHVFRIWSAGYHLVNLLIHAGSTILLWLIARRILQGHWPALFAALFFGINAPGAEAVIWVSGRADLLSCFFMFLALYCFLFPETNRYAGFAAGSLILALFSKESAVIFPAWLLLLSDPVQSKSNSLAEKVLQKIRKYRIPLLIVLLAGLFHLYLQFKTGPYLMRMDEKATVLSYLRNVIQGSTYTLLNPLESFFVMDTTGWIFPCFSLLIVTMACRERRFRLLFLFVLIVVSILPVALVPFPFLPKPWLTFGRFFYLASAAAALFWATVFQRIGTSPGRVSRVTAALLCFGFLAVSAHRVTEKVDEWNSVTRVRYEAIQRLRYAISQVHEQKKVAIVTEDIDFQPEMLRLLLPHEVLTETSFEGRRPPDEERLIHYSQGQIRLMK